MRNSKFEIRNFGKRKKELVHKLVNNVDKLIHKAVEAGGKVLHFVFFRAIIMVL